MSQMKESKILVVDDDPVIRNALFEFLSSRGYQVSLAQNGKEGVMKFQEAEPELVILDLIMPEMDGVEALEKIREIDPEAKVIVLTGYGTDEQIARLKELGVTDILRKGLGFEDFLAQIEGVLGRSPKPLSKTSLDPTEIKVLVADDDAVIRTLLVEFLVSKGFQVLNAGDGEEALSSINKNRPDLVFLDLVMPKKEGEAVLKEVSEDTLKSTKWVLITGNSDKLQKLKIEADYKVLEKPFSLETFEETVDSLLLEYSLPT